MADKIENPKELSQKELTEKRDEITKYYTEHIPHLEKQLEYENLLRDIEKCRAERMQAQMFMTKMAATPPEPEIKKEFDNAKMKTPQPAPEVKRSLKKAVKSE